MATAEMVRAYGAAWNEEDEGARRQLLEQGFAEDGVYCDPMGTADGREAFIHHIGGLQQTMPGHRLEVTTSVDEHDGYFRFGWELRDPEGTVAMEGVDFGHLAADGRIARITGFFGPLAP